MKTENEVDQDVPLSLDAASEASGGMDGEQAPMRAQFAAVGAADAAPIDSPIKVGS